MQRLEKMNNELQGQLMAAEQELHRVRKDLEMSEKAKLKIEETRDSYLRELRELKEKHKILTLSKVNEDLTMIVDP